MTSVDDDVDVWEVVDLLHALSTYRDGSVFSSAFQAALDVELARLEPVQEGLETKYKKLHRAKVHAGIEGELRRYFHEIAHMTGKTVDELMAEERRVGVLSGETH